MDLTAAWLRRIGIDGRPEPTVATLNRVIGHQLRSIPFENLAVLHGEVPALDPRSLRGKLIDARRGGYCHELNGLLCAGLRGLGFEVAPMLARVLWRKDEPGPRSHMFLRIEAEGAAWLADAGFGGPGPSGALPLGAQALRAGPYRLAPEPGLGTVLSRVEPGTPAALYAFTDEPVGPPDVEAANWLTATWPRSVFRTRVMAALGDSDRRHSLDGRIYACSEDGERVEEIVLATAGEVADRLEVRFGIAINSADRRLLSRVAGPARS